MAQANVRQFLGDTPNWTVKVTDAFAGFEERGVDRMTDRHRRAVACCSGSRRRVAGGRGLIGYVPTVMQVKTFVDALREHGGFGAVQVDGDAAALLAREGSEHSAGAPHDRTHRLHRNLPRLPAAS